MSKLEGKRGVLLLSIANPNQKIIIQPSVVVARTESSVKATTKKSGIRKVRSHGKSASRRYLEEKYER